MREEKKKFMRRSAVFLSVFIVIFLLLNAFYIRNIEEQKLIYQKEIEWQKQIAQLPDRTLDYAFFGDSHTQDGLNPMYIPHSFNFANSGEDYIETYFHFRKILEKDEVRIKTAVLELDVSSFSNKLRTNETLLYELRHFTKFMTYEELSERKKQSKLSIWVRKTFPILGGGQYILQYAMGRLHLTPTQMGWTNNTNNFAETDRTHLNIYGEHNFDSDTINYDSLNHLLALLELAREHDVKVVFIQYPHAVEYDDEIKRRNISRDDYYDEVFSIIDEQGIDYVVLDYYEEFFDRPDLLGDGSHLNFRGSKIISERMVEDSKSFVERSEVFSSEKKTFVPLGTISLTKTIPLN